MRCEQHDIMAASVSSRRNPCSRSAGEDVGDASYPVDLYLRVAGGNEDAHDELGVLFRLALVADWLGRSLRRPSAGASQGLSPGHPSQKLGCTSLPYFSNHRLVEWRDLIV